MTQWNGSELPPAAQARIARAASDHVRSSLLTIGGQGAVEDAGLDPVGEVMGCIVEHIGFAGYRGCGWGYGGIGSYALGGGPPVTSAAGGWVGYAPYVDAVYHGYDVALRRMLLEAQALGADGVIGVRWSRERLGEAGAQEFVARGTAVRVRSSIRPAGLFSTDLGGADVSKLMQAGWFPAALAIGLCVAIRHDDYATRRAAGSWAVGNVEVTGYSELVGWARADARDQFHDRARRSGADAATVTDMRLHVWAVEPNEGHTDHVAEASVIGNAIVQFGPADVPSTDSALALPLRRRPS
jgi:uncharacterized protein YbjQ (UPF0145 family)